MKSGERLDEVMDGCVAPACKGLTLNVPQHQYEDNCSERKHANPSYAISYGKHQYKIKERAFEIAPVLVVTSCENPVLLVELFIASELSASEDCSPDW